MSKETEKPKVVFQCTRTDSKGRLINLPDLQMVMRSERVEAGIPLPGVSRFLKANAAAQYVIPEGDVDYDQMLAQMKKWFVTKYGLIQVGAEQEGVIPKVETEADRNMKKMETALSATLKKVTEKDDTIGSLKAETEELKRRLAALGQTSTKGK